ncbi:hypothetical protein T440DRAFT_11455 [Plenodomus tracheiphilus IPT5]|uniref:Uncharacterized protein n=1 Tax=Plenodomus tracheiphilus IPT5 TaxID=1408161 RepID=A0A6A7BPL6_9PLEO|nr:hypothetical protein T440DRAFT_11455 [Plenodomus tracheiphilus IPT5]
MQIMLSCARCSISGGTYASRSGHARLRHVPAVQCLLQCRTDRGQGMGGDGTEARFSEGQASRAPQPHASPHGLDNWLISIEVNQHGEPQTQSHADHILKKEDSVTSPDQQRPRGTKRVISGSPTSQHIGDHLLSYELKDDHLREQQVASLPLRLSPERLRRTISLPNRKRLKFSDTVEFRDDYRDSSQYLRTDEKYERGRYAPPDGSEYLDTSGSAQTFLKFTGVRRVKGDWVEVTEADTASKRKGRQAAVEGTPDDAGMLEGPAGPIPHKINDVESAPPDQRALRLARRTRSSTSGVSVTQHGSSAGPVGTSLYAKATQMSPSILPEHFVETSGHVAIPPLEEQKLDIVSRAVDEKSNGT